MSAGLSVDKTKVRSSFAAAAESYDGVAALQRTVGLALLKSMATAPISETVLDLGCGTGFITNELLSSYPIKHMLALDIALPMLHKSRAKLSRTNIAYLCADAEQLPFANHTIDYVFSNLALQWCQNLSSVFTDLKQIIKPGGQFSFAIFGTKTLQELKAAWAEVDSYRHVNEFYSADQLHQLLSLAGFADIQFESQCHISRYDSVLALMKELKQLGAHHVQGRNPQFTSRANLERMITAYERDGNEQGISATFEVIIMTAKA